MSVSGPLTCVIKLEKVDDRGVAVQLAEEERAAKAAMADDQVRLHVRAGFEGR